MTLRIFVFPCICFCEFGLCTVVNCYICKQHFTVWNGLLSRKKYPTIFVKTLFHSPIRAIENANVTIVIIQERKVLFFVSTQRSSTPASLNYSRSEERCDFRIEKFFLIFLVSRTTPWTQDDFSMETECCTYTCWIVVSFLAQSNAEKLFQSLVCKIRVLWCQKTTRHLHCKRWVCKLL